MALASTSVLLVGQTPQMSVTSICVHKERSQWPHISLGGPRRTVCGPDPGFFQLTASALGPRACVIVPVPFKSRVSVNYSPLALLAQALLVRKAWRSAACFPTAGPGELDVGFGLHSLGKTLQWQTSSCSWVPYPILWVLTSQFLLLVSLWFFHYIFLLWKIFCTILQVFFIDSCSLSTFKSMQEVKVMIFLICPFGHTPLF